MNIEQIIHDLDLAMKYHEEEFMKCMEVSKLHSDQARTHLEERDRIRSVSKQIKGETT